jgi:hypothetical protein
MMNGTDSNLSTYSTPSSTLDHAFGRYGSPEQSLTCVTDPGTQLNVLDTIEINNFLSRKCPTSTDEPLWSEKCKRSNPKKVKPGFWREVVNRFFS